MLIALIIYPNYPNDGCKHDFIAMAEDEMRMEQLIKMYIGSVAKADKFPIKPINEWGDGSKVAEYTGEGYFKVGAYISILKISSENFTMSTWSIDKDGELRHSNGNIIAGFWSTQTAQELEKHCARGDYQYIQPITYGI